MSSPNAADAFAFGMLGVILLAFGVILLLVLHMKRQARRSPGDEVQRLMDEVEAEWREQETAGDRGNGGGRREKTASQPPWERDADWWREG